MANEQSAAKHTPGPWRFGEVERHEGHAYQRVCDTWGDGLSSNIVARVCIEHSANHELNADGRANAHLITAAPDLLRVAELLVDWLNEEPGAHQLCDTARAAIAKATGVAS